MREKQPDGSPPESPVSTDDPSLAPPKVAATPEPVLETPPTSVGLRSVFAQWVVATKRQSLRPGPPQVPRPTPRIPAPIAPEPTVVLAPSVIVESPAVTQPSVVVRAPVVVGAPVVVQTPAPPPSSAATRTPVVEPSVVVAPSVVVEPPPAIAPANSIVADSSETPSAFEFGVEEFPETGDVERTQLYQRVPEHLLRKTRPSDSPSANIEVGFPTTNTNEDERTAVFAPPSELLLMARGRALAARVGPAAGAPPPAPEAPKTGAALSDEEASVSERIASLSGARERDDEVSERIASLSGARERDDVTQTAEFRRVMRKPSTRPPPALAPGRSPWYRAIGLAVALIAAGGVMFALHFWRR